MLLMHGYGATGSTFYALVNDMKRYYRITTIDHLGLGASGRPEYNLKTPQECLDYYLYSTEAWMLASKYREGPAPDYILLGHSLGGYIAGHFALKFP